VQDAPNVAKNCIIAIGDLAETANLPDDRCVLLAFHCALGYGGPARLSSLNPFHYGMSPPGSLARNLAERKTAAPARLHGA
jgi:hypothetical protein